jgi:hypothetical protein
MSAPTRHHTAKVFFIIILLFLEQNFQCRPTAATKRQSNHEHRITKSVPASLPFEIGHSTLDILRFAVQALRKLQRSLSLRLKGLIHLIGLNPVSGSFPRFRGKTFPCPLRKWAVCRENQECPCWSQRDGLRQRQSCPPLQPGRHK